MRILLPILLLLLQLLPTATAATTDFHCLIPVPFLLANKCMQDIGLFLPAFWHGMLLNSMRAPAESLLLKATAPQGMGGNQVTGAPGNAAFQ